MRLYKNFIAFFLLLCFSCVCQTINAEDGVYVVKGDKVIVREGVTEINKEDLKELRFKNVNIQLPLSLRKIGNSAFEYVRITSISIPNGVTSIGEEAFKWNHELEKVHLPEGLTSIGKNAFNGCSSLSTINLPESICEIGDSAFYGCRGLEFISIPSSLHTVGTDAFHGCEKINQLVYYDNGRRCNGWIGHEDSCPKDIVIPPGVIAIDKHAFLYANVEHISLPEGLKYIGKGAFSYKLKRTNIPNSVDFIGDGALSCYLQRDGTKIDGKSGLLIYANGTKCYDWIGNIDSCPSTLVIPEGVTAINGQSFFRFYKLEEVILPSSLKQIGVNAFAQCKNLKKVVLPNTVEKIEENAFSYCNQLKDIDIPQNCEYSKGCFEGCDSLNVLLITDHGTVCRGWSSKHYDGLVVIPQGVKTIESKAFEDCYKIKGVVLPDGLDFIGSMAFKGCSGIEEIYMPNSVRGVGYHVFESCTYLKKVHLSENLTDIPSGMFFSCCSLENVVIPNTVVRIGENAFSNCSRLKSVDIPDQVTCIDRYVFSNCSSLEYVKWPSALSAISEYAFENCPKLNKDDIPSRVDVDRDAFGKSTATYLSEHSGVINTVIISLFLDLALFCYLRKVKLYSMKKAIAISVAVYIGVALVCFLLFIGFIMIMFSGGYHG